MLVWHGGGGGGGGRLRSPPLSDLHVSQGDKEAAIKVACDDEAETSKGGWNLILSKRAKSGYKYVTAIGAKWRARPLPLYTPTPPPCVAQTMSL